jgi:hypothetical protein
MNDELLLSQARAALGRGPAPSPAVLAAIHEAAVQCAVLRKDRLAHVRRLWHRGVAAFGGLAAAALVVVAAWPSLRPPRPAASHPVTAAAAAAETLSEDTLALMALVEGFSIPHDGNVASDALLRLQESPGGFEDAHALYASF